MGRRRKIPSPAATDHTIMRMNIEARLRVMFPRSSGVTQQYKSLAKLSGVGAETIRKLMHEDSNPALKSISAISEAIGLKLPELFSDPSAADRDASDAAESAKNPKPGDPPPTQPANKKP